MHASFSFFDWTLALGASICGASFSVTHIFPKELLLVNLVTLNSLVPNWTAPCAYIVVANSTLNFELEHLECLFVDNAFAVDAGTVELLALRCCHLLVFLHPIKFSCVRLAKQSDKLRLYWPYFARGSRTVNLADLVVINDNLEVVNHALSVKLVRFRNVQRILVLFRQWFVADRTRELIRNLTGDEWLVECVFHCAKDYYFK